MMVRFAAPLLGALLLGAPLARAQEPGSRFEPNQTRRTARAIEQGHHKAIFCNEEDWFYIDVPRGQRLEVQVKFDHSRGDLELLLQDTRGKNLAWSRGARNEEAASFTPPADTRVFVRVYNDDTVYDLYVGLAPTTWNGEVAQGLNCWGADWYPIAVEAGKELRADLSFAHARGDLDLTLFDEEQNELASSTGQGDAEAVRWAATAEGRTVLLRVWSPHGGRNVYGLRAAVTAATPEDMPRVLRRERPAAGKGDIIELTNGDVLRGEVLNQSFALATSYTEIELPARRVAGIDLERNRSEIETVVTVDNNKLSGFLRTPAFRVKLEGLEQPVDIRRERVVRVVFGCRGDERAGLERNQYVVLRNGDHFSARVLTPESWVLDTGFARLPVNLQTLKAITFDGEGGVNVTRLTEMSTRGRLNVEELEVEMDIGQGPGRRFKVHPDRVETLFCQAGYQPDAMQASGTALTFDFEDGIEPWVPAGNWNTNWVHSQREGVRGEGCMRCCGPNGANYGDNANVSVTSPALTVGALQNPVLRLQVRTRLERGPDFFTVRLSYDGGNTYQEVHRMTGDNEWTQVTLPIAPGNREVMVQLGLTTDGSIVNLGVWVDAVEVVEQGQGQ